jgi:hypothetical protein
MTVSLVWPTGAAEPFLFVRGHGDGDGAELAIGWFENEQRRKQVARHSHWRRWLREHPYPD